MNKYHRLYLNIWNRCNLNCKHCFNDGGKTQNKVLSYTEIIKLIEEAQESLGIEEVQISGGEPTQRPDLFPIIGELLKRGIKVLLQTNGIFDNIILNELLQLPTEYVSLIISLDGILTNDYFRGQGCAEKTIKNIKILSHKFQIRINILLSAILKWNEVESLAQLAKKYDLILAFNPICPTGRANSSILMPPDKYFEWMYCLENLRLQGVRLRKTFDLVKGQLVEKAKCPLRRGITFNITADGSVYPCGFLVNNPSCFLGSIRNHSLVELLGKIKSDCKVIPNECKKCKFYINGYCHAGCPARIYALYKSFDKPDIYCIAKYLNQNKSDEAELVAISL